MNKILGAYYNYNHIDKVIRYGRHIFVGSIYENYIYKFSAEDKLWTVVFNVRNISICNSLIEAKTALDELFLKNEYIIDEERVSKLLLLK